MTEKHLWHSDFPDSLPDHEVFSTYFEKLAQEYQIKKERITPAYSLCPDELNQEVIQLIHQYFGHSFALGGLAGYPFSGKTGFNAFADHVPDGGDAFIFFGPHLSVGASQFGRIQRLGQERETLSCGAALGAYQSLQMNKSAGFSEDDYQIDRLRLMLRQAYDEGKTEIPELQVTSIIFNQSAEFMKEQARRIKDQFKLRHVFLLGGVVLNTPPGECDYIDVRLFEVI